MHEYFALKKAAQRVAWITAVEPRHFNKRYTFARAILRHHANAMSRMRRLDAEGWRNAPDNVIPHSLQHKVCFGCFFKSVGKKCNPKQILP